MVLLSAVLNPHEVMVQLPVEPASVPLALCEMPDMTTVWLGWTAWKDVNGTSGIGAGAALAAVGGGGAGGSLEEPPPPGQGGAGQGGGGAPNRRPGGGR